MVAVSAQQNVANEVPPTPNHYIILPHANWTLKIPIADMNQDHVHPSGPGRRVHLQEPLLPHHKLGGADPLTPRLPSDLETSYVLPTTPVWSRLSGDGWGTAGQW